MPRPQTLRDLITRPHSPRPWQDGDNLPWDDPAFSTRMLREHLTQDHDLASRRFEIIDRHVDWLHREVLDGRSSLVLDLACGPGLYTERLARLGHRCVGIDFSPASIAYARERAAQESLPASYLLADLRNVDPGTGFELVTLLYGQINVFRREEARALLARALTALGQGGRLVLEPQTEAAVRAIGSGQSTWSTAESGLFSDRPYLLLHESAFDEESRTATERWYVVDAGTGAVERLALSTVAWTLAELQALLGDLGFSSVEALTELSGCAPGGPTAALVAFA